MDSKDFDAEEKLSQVLNELKGDGPNLAFGIENQSGKTWGKPALYLICGNKDTESERVYYGKWILQM